METSRNKLELITKYFADFTEHQIQQLTALEELYKEWNSKINVVSRKDIESLYLNHVLHSLSIAAVIQFHPGTRIVDIGCGGGFPGVPLAIFFPEVEFHLVDSIAKKLKVVDAVCEGANIQNITTQHIRAEEIKGRKFDFAVSRAVAPLKDLLRWSHPLIEKGKKQELANGLICLKGGDLTQEIFESDARPGVVSITSLFKEDYFQEKFVLHVAR